MISKKDFVKINDYLWELPKSFGRDMRVPARVYASDKIWEQIESHALEQVINVASLPGIVKYSLAMPDCHQGYGMVIGGVAATEYPEGVISPGGIGYDQNCLPANSRILLKNGVYLSVGQLEKHWPNREVETVHFQRKKIEDSSIIRFFKRHNNPTIYRIIVESGEEIQATGDHPVQTKEGMKEIKKLYGNESVLIYPFKGLKYKRPSSKVLLEKKDIIKTLKKVGKEDRARAFDQILSFIESKKILPLKHDSWQLPIILKLMGYIFGDGVISFIDKKGIVQFYGNPEDLREIQKDIKEIGFNPPKIYSRKRKHSITTFYDTYKFSHVEHSCRVGSTGFAALLIALGTPYSRKAHQEYRVPKWIFDCPLWQQRLFLASFFGAELSTPNTMNKYNFYAPQLNMQKVKGLEKNAKLFLKDIVKLLDEFKINTHAIVDVPGYRYKGVQGETVGFRLQISERAENLIRFFETVNYEYNQNKRREACLAVNYLKRKLRVVEVRTKARKAIKRDYKKKGDFKKLAKKYSSRYAPPQFLYHSLFEENSWGVRRKRGYPRIAFDFLSFEEYKNQYAYGKQGLVWDKIEKIEKIPYADFVFDFTVNHPAHNFIANNFVVSNCGIRILKSEYTEKEGQLYLDKLATEMQREVPSGLGRGRRTKLSIEQINKILEGGVPELVEQGYGEKEDIENCEEQGKMEQADASCVSERAKMRGRDQVGTLGSGNHFVQLDKVEEIFDEEVAKVFGLFKDQVVVMIHTGSRGLGHQNCTDYLKIVMQAMPKYNIKLPDRELACVPFNSPEGQRFFKAMSAACNYAWANRHMIAFYVREAWEKVLGKKAKLELLYDVAHNIAKIEEHEVNGKMMKLIVHRKGATRAFPAGHSEIPERYKETGQPVLIPGSMGTASYVLAGTKKGEEAFYSTCHGAGRAMSRHAAMRQVRGEEVVKNLQKKGILIKCRSMRGIAEEAPLAYKNIEDVVEVVHQAGLSKKVAKLMPLAVIKGE